MRSGFFWRLGNPARCKTYPHRVRFLLPHTTTYFRTTAPFQVPALELIPQRKLGDACHSARRIAALSCTLSNGRNIVRERSHKNIHALKPLWALPDCGDWSDREHSEIDRIRLACVEHPNLKVEFGQTDECDPWFIVYDWAHEKRCQLKR